MNLDRKLDRVLSNKVGIYKSVNEVQNDLTFYLNKICNRKKDLSQKKYDKYRTIILKLHHKIRVSIEKMENNKLRKNNTTIKVTKNN